MSDPTPPEDQRPFSQVLEDVAAVDAPKVSLEELVDAFAERGFGALLLLLGLVSVAIGAVPGSTTVLGVPILLIAFQLIIRRDQLWMPRWALRSSIDRASYRTAVAKLVGPFRRIERLSRPRLSFMSTDLSEALIGVACFLLAFILILPIWGGNLAPSLAIAAFGFGLMQRDGVVMLIAWAGVAASVVILFLLGSAAIEGVQALIHRFLPA